VLRRPAPAGELEIIAVGVSGQDRVAGLLIWGICHLKGSRTRAGSRVVCDHVPGAFPEIAAVGDIVFQLPLGQGDDTFHHGRAGHHNHGRYHGAGQQISHQANTSTSYSSSSPATHKNPAVPAITHTSARIIMHRYSSDRLPLDSGR
jgi:hypothetical protein